MQSKLNSPSSKQHLKIYSAFQKIRPIFLSMELIRLANSINLDLILGLLLPKDVDFIIEINGGTPPSLIFHHLQQQQQQHQ